MFAIDFLLNRLIGAKGSASDFVGHVDGRTHTFLRRPDTRTERPGHPASIEQLASAHENRLDDSLPRRQSAGRPLRFGRLAMRGGVRNHRAVADAVPLASRTALLNAGTSWAFPKNTSQPVSS
jgi:hypothetical protein